MKGNDKMTAINLDNKLNVQNKVEVTIAGKEYSLLLNDEIGKEITNTLLEIDDGTKPIRDENELEELEKADLEVQKETVCGALDSVRDTEIRTFDKILGRGEGKRIYKYYGNSTQALTFLLTELQKIYNKSITLKKEKKKKKKAKKRRKYIKK